MQARPHRNIPGNINVCARFIRDAFYIAVRHDAVVATERTGEGNVLITGKANECAFEARGANKCCGAETRLGGCRTNHDMLHTKPVVIQKQIHNYVTGINSGKKMQR